MRIVVTGYTWRTNDELLGGLFGKTRDAIVPELYPTRQQAEFLAGGRVVSGCRIVCEISVEDV